MTRSTLVRLLASFWLVGYTTTVYALVANISLARDLRGFDYESLGFAAVLGFLGGVAQTIVWLMGESAIVVHVWRQMLRDVVTALMGGAVVYIAFTMLAAVWPSVLVRELTFGVVFFAGFSRGRWRTALADLAGAGLQRARAIVTGQPIQTLPPATVPAQLGDK